MINLLLFSMFFALPPFLSFSRPKPETIAKKKSVTWISCTAMEERKRSENEGWGHTSTWMPSCFGNTPNLGPGEGGSEGGHVE